MEKREVARCPDRASTSHYTVGVAGFEPTTSSSRTKRATKLRHTPREASTAYRTDTPPNETALGASVTDSGAGQVQDRSKSVSTSV